MRKVFKKGSPFKTGERNDQQYFAKKKGARSTAETAELGEKRFALAKKKERMGEKLWGARGRGSND